MLSRRGGSRMGLHVMRQGTLHRPMLLNVRAAACGAELPGSASSASCSRLLRRCQHQQQIEQHTHPQRPLLRQRRAPLSAPPSALHPALLASITAAASQPQPHAAAAAATATVGLITSANLPALLTSAGVFVLSLAASVFLICAIPTLWALARLALSAAALVRQLERELPETAAVLRLSGLEVTDCVSEMAKLGGDLTAGVRSTARLVSMTETGVKQAATVAGQQIKPALAATEKKARGVVEAGLQQRAELDYTGPVIAQLGTQTVETVRKLRLGMAVARAATAAVDFGRAVRGRAMQVAAQHEAAQRAAAVDGAGGATAAPADRPSPPPPQPPPPQPPPQAGSPPQ